MPEPNQPTSESTTAPVLVCRATDAEVLDADPTSMITLLADAEETGGKLTSNLTHFEPGNAGPPHHHSRGAELFYVLDGSLQMLLGEEVTVFGKGDLVVVPPGLHHAFAPGPGRQRRRADRVCPRHRALRVLPPTRPTPPGRRLGAGPVRHPGPLR
jgi:quercetin dioxygenase-like cupin family protein